MHFDILTIQIILKLRLKLTHKFSTTVSLFTIIYAIKIDILFYKKFCKFNNIHMYIHKDSKI